MCTPGQVTQVPVLSYSTWKGLTLPALSVSLALSFYPERRVPQSTTGEIVMSDVWRKCLFLLPSPFQKREDLPPTILFFCPPTPVIITSLSSEFQERPYPGSSAWKYSAIKVACRRHQLSVKPTCQQVGRAALCAPALRQKAYEVRLQLCLQGKT